MYTSARNFAALFHMQYTVYSDFVALSLARVHSHTAALAAAGQCVSHYIYFWAKGSHLIEGIGSFT